MATKLSRIKKNGVAQLERKAQQGILDEAITDYFLGNYQHVIENKDCALAIGIQITTQKGTIEMSYYFSIGSIKKFGKEQITDNLYRGVELYSAHDGEHTSGLAGQLNDFLFQVKWAGFCEDEEVSEQLSEDILKILNSLPGSWFEYDE